MEFCDLACRGIYLAAEVVGVPDPFCAKLIGPIPPSGDLQSFVGSFSTSSNVCRLRNKAFLQTIKMPANGARPAGAVAQEERGKVRMFSICALI